MDILQSAALKALEHRNAPAPGDLGYRAWFYKVVHNQSIDWLRSRRRLVDIAQTPAEEADGIGPDDLLEQERRMGESREQAIDRMIEEARGLGPNAVVGVGFTTSLLSQGAAELLAYGTAVVVENE